ncbi:lysine exporter LysO family protein [Basilea psittacipulmonis]|uniref:Lysine exporter LysO family protein n=1 Tax=Basilea psittacipulmonis DSM 24701 TaxID=1072685 RepID=A0A077DJS4_9BURK|nr:lysine exporter LysO family protein [Basilea psittacipulmonis]AIL33343.1 hypothetical protein IX83_08555 [Basilea psittacipulmonis DSM 24701]
MNVFVHAILPIFIALALGFVAGRILSHRSQQFLSKAQTLLIYILLLCIGFELSHNFPHFSAISTYIGWGVLYGIVTSLGSFFVVYLIYRTRAKKTTHATETTTPPTATLLDACLPCAIPILFFLVGVACAKSMQVLDLNTDLIPSSEHILWYLLFLIGSDLSRQLNLLKFPSKPFLWVPLFSILGAYLAAILLSFISDLTVLQAVLVSSGMGWYSLSGSLISSQYQASLGTIALCSDLTREILSIILIYVWGQKQTLSCIACAGATAMDVTLPIIKKNTDHSSLVLALYSGIVISFVVPLLLMATLSLLL